MEGSQERAGINEGKRYDVSGLVSCKDSDNMSTGRPLQQKFIEEVLERASSACQRKEQWKRDGK